MAVSQSIAAAAAVRHALDEPAAAETGEVIRQGLAGDTEGFRQIGGVAGGFAQSQEHAGTGGIGERMSQASDGGRVGQGGESGCHVLDDTEDDEFRKS